MKGAEQVFVIAQNNGKNVVYGWADIVNGQVNAGKTVAKKAAKTRAGETCPVTKGETTEIDLTYTYNNPNIYVWKGNSYTWDELVELTQKVYDDLTNKNEFQYRGEQQIPFVANSVIVWKHIKDEYGNEWDKIDGLNFDNAQLQSNAEKGGDVADMFLLFNNSTVILNFCKY